MSMSPGPSERAADLGGDHGIAGLATEILETVADAFYAIDAAWRVVYINRPAALLLGAARESVVGCILWERFPRLDESEAGRCLREAVARRETVEFETLSPTVGRWLWARVSPLAGGLYGVYWRDITARRQQEEALRRSNQRLHLAMDAARFGAWEFDIQSGERDWSEPAKRVMGIPAGIEPSYEALIAAAHPDDRERVAAAYRRSYDPASGGLYQVEYRVIDPDGGERWVSARGRALFDSTGKPVRMIGVTLDITEEKRREQELRESQERFRTMLEALPQIAFVIRTDGVAEYYNKRFEEYVGHKVGTTLEARLALQHPDDRRAIVAARSAGVTADREYAVEARVRRWDGAYRWHVIRNVPMKQGGKTVAWLGTAIDIHDMREAQDALRRSNDELESWVADRTRDLAETNARLRASEGQQRRLFARAPVPMHALDGARRILDVNDAWLRLFGYAREEVIGRAIAEFHAPGQPALHDARWQELLRRGELRDLERRFLKKSGEAFEALVSVHLERDEDGNFLRTITTTIDIAARKRAEAAARHERQLSELLIECGTEGIIGLDRDMRYIVWNPAMEAMSGLTRAQVLGRHLFELRPDLAGSPVEAAWRATMEGKRTTLRDRLYDFAPAGRRGYCDVDFAPLYGPDRSIIGGFAFLRDTTERRQIEEQLRQAQKMEAVGQLTGGVAHDFNNLLTVIIGNIENVQRYLPPRAEAQRMIAAIMRAATRAATLTHRLLAFARRQPLEPRAVDINKLVAGMSELLRRSLGETILIETVLAGGLWRTLADPNQLENALLNLAVNARDAMAGGGKLTIETANAFLDESYAAQHQDVASGQYVMIAMSDTGGGMSAETIEKAFEPFFTTKEVGQGTGLGLPQVYGFVKQSGGHVKIYSELGHGTTVKLYLPRLAAGEVASDVAAEAKPVPNAGANAAILLVEDDEDVRQYSAEILRETGYRVVEAAEGATALKALAEEPGIRLLFTDVGLPGGLNGRQLADEARRRRPDLKVLFTTGYARNAIVHQGRLDPGVALLLKPFTAASLTAMVSQVLGGEVGARSR
jgi:PAS domain S-box-containing protein